jgi:hypothetical protein
MAPTRLETTIANGHVVIQRFIARHKKIRPLGRFFFVIDAKILLLFLSALFDAVTEHFKNAPG